MNISVWREEGGYRFSHVRYPKDRTGKHIAKTRQADRRTERAGSNYNYY